MPWDPYNFLPRCWVKYLLETYDFSPARGVKYLLVFLHFFDDSVENKDLCYCSLLTKLTPVCILVLALWSFWFDLGSFGWKVWRGHKWGWLNGSCQLCNKSLWLWCQFDSGDWLLWLYFPLVRALLQILRRMRLSPQFFKTSGGIPSSPAFVPCLGEHFTFFN